VESRHERLAAAGQDTFDAVIIGGGVNGACLYDRLCRAGYRALLLDRGDFAAGTSQASAMMVWGGLLYLRCLDFGSVHKFSRARDRMVREWGELVVPRRFRYLAPPKSLVQKYLVFAGLYIYWLIGNFNRRRPTLEAGYPESGLLTRSGDSLTYEEAVLTLSDSRFVLHWITPHGTGRGVALNYCAVEGGDYHAAEKTWRLQAREGFSGEELEIRTRLVVNCAGVWTDGVNAAFGVHSPYKHVLSKGVFINFPRPAEHKIPLIFEMGEHWDVITSVPWGPVAMWGPTETAIDSLEPGFLVTPEDVRFLLDHRRRCLKDGSAKTDIVSLRCGVRPLAVDRGFDHKVYPLELSRRYRVASDDGRPWISTYGGKLTGCTQLAASVCETARRFLPPASPTLPDKSRGAVATPIYFSAFPGLEAPVPDVAWCRSHEFCHTLDDYLRRRTNIAQWIPRGGLGRRDEHLADLRAVSLVLNDGDAEAAEVELDAYRTRVVERFDDVLKSV
jgi:glycerol-3-phosphate dehydrogenase